MLPRPELRTKKPAPASLGPQLEDGSPHQGTGILGRS